MGPHQGTVRKVIEFYTDPLFIEEETPSENKRMGSFYCEEGTMWVRKGGRLRIPRSLRGLRCLGFRRLAYRLPLREPEVHATSLGEAPNE